MAWTRVVCGRLKSDYRYSAKIVYNNFPWPEPTEQQKQKIEETAHGILDARALFPDSSLADLYDPLTMPVELRKAHIARRCRVRATACSHSATTVATIAETPMNKAIQAESESMGAKPMFNSLGEEA